MHICASLGPDALLRMGAVHSSLVGVSREDHLWQWHVQAVQLEYPEVTIGRPSGVAMFEHFIKFRAAVEENDAEESALLIDDFRNKMTSMRSLSAYGTLSGQGSADATFEPFGGGMPIQTTNAVALELLDLMKTVPKEKGVKVGTMYEKAAAILGVNQQSLRKLETSAKSHRASTAAKRDKLVLFLRAAFPMISGTAPAAATAATASVSAGETDALIEEVLNADVLKLSPRKIAMRQGLLEARGERDQLKIEIELLRRKQADEREQFATRLASDEREIRRLSNRIEVLEMESTSSLRRQLKAAQQQLQTQVKAKETMQRHAQTIAEKLQAAREEAAKDLITKRDESAHQRRLLERAEATLKEARGAQAAAERLLVEADARTDRAKLATKQAEAVAKRKHEEWLRDLEDRAIEQSKAGQCDDHMEFIAGCVNMTIKPGETKRYKQANTSRRGPGSLATRCIVSKKGFGDLKSRTQKGARSEELSKHMVATAKGEEHVATMMLFHKRANPELYRQIGIKERVSLKSSQLVSICVRMTGAIGKAMHRALRQAGVDVDSWVEVQRALKCSDHSHETLKLSRPNTNPKTKAKFPLVHGGVCRVTDVGKVLQETADRADTGDYLSWPPNIPDGEIWFCFLADKGGGSDKLCAKLLCDELMDSVGHMVLLALVDGIGDDYVAKEMALRPVYRQIDHLVMKGFTIHAPWRPRMPKHIMLDDNFNPIIKPAAPAPPKAGSVVEARVSVSRNRLGARWVHVKLRPRQLAASSSSKSPSIFGKKSSLLSPATVTRPISTHITTSRRLMDASLVEAAETWVGGMSAGGTSEEPTGNVSEEPTGNVSEEPRRLGFSPKAQRIAHCLEPGTHGPGQVLPRVEHPPIRLKGCTWNADCTKCTDELDGEIQAIQRQCAACRTREGAPRRFRPFFGGDFLSIQHPMGLQGPTSTSFCHGCHGRLNQTNTAGGSGRWQGAASRRRLRGVADNRPSSIRDPPPRLGTKAIHKCQQALKRARALHEAGIGKKPSEAAYHSCVNEPLFNVDNPKAQTSFVSLHVMLGQGLKVWNELEEAVKLLDAAHGKHFSTVPEDEQLKADMLECSNELEILVGKLEELDTEESSHETGMELIANTPDSEEAIKRAEMPAAGEALPLEAEYRVHVAGLAAAKKARKKHVERVVALHQKVEDIRAKEPGPHERKFLDRMAALKLKKEAYHGGSFVGDDIHHVFDPEVIIIFCEILGDSSIKVIPELTVAEDGKVNVKLTHVNFGSKKRQDDFVELCNSFSDAISVFARNTALCEHNIVSFQDRTDRYAKAYATTLPTVASQPKTHMLCAEMPEQAEAMGSPGMLNESPIESQHVRDNMLKRRYATTTDLVENLRLRAQANDRLADTRVENLMALEDATAARKRSKYTSASRKRKAHAAER